MGYFYSFGKAGMVGNIENVNVFKSCLKIFFEIWRDKNKNKTTRIYTDKLFKIRAFISKYK